MSLPSSSAVRFCDIFRDACISYNFHCKLPAFGFVIHFWQTKHLANEKMFFNNVLDVYRSKLSELSESG